MMFISIQYNMMPSWRRETHISLAECVWWNCKNKRKQECVIGESLEASALMSLLLMRVGANVFQGPENCLWNWWRRGQMSTLWVVTVLIGSVGKLHQLSLWWIVGRGAARVLSAHALLLLSYAIGGLILVGVAAILLDVTLEISRFGSRVKGIRSCLGNGEEGNAENELYRNGR